MRTIREQFTAGVSFRFQFGIPLRREEILAVKEVSIAYPQFFPRIAAFLVNESGLTTGGVRHYPGDARMADW
jgi:hypothetical protein